MKFALVSPLGLVIDALPASPLPVDLDLVKEHCAVDGADLDDLLTTYTLAAIEWAENFTGRTIFRRGHVWILDNFPQTVCTRIRLPRGLARSVAQIQYYDGAGALQTMRGPTGSPVGTDFSELLTMDDGGVLVPNPVSDAWPDALREAVAPVQISFEAGWDAADVPQQLLHAILFAVSDMLETRGQADLAAGGPSFETRMALASPFMLARFYV